MSTPAEDNLVGLDIDLVDEAVLNPPVLGTTHRGQVTLGDVDCSDQNGAICGKLTLVDIDARFKRRWVQNRHKVLFLAIQGDTVDLVVRAVQDADMPEPEATFLNALPNSNYRLAIQYLRLKSGVISGHALPHELAIIRIDDGMGNFVNFIRWGKEQEPRLRRAQFGDIQDWSLDRRALECFLWPFCRCSIGRLCTGKTEAAGEDRQCLGEAAQK